ncbi:hypothetical protein A5641_11915 [Mycobacterium sp. 1554424.7]|nr:hypothetical protein A5641_11915 [Mycobacterium sp. 1554424.7]
MEYLIDLAEEVRQGNGTGEDSWIAGQRIAAAARAAPDEIKASAARVAAALFGFVQHPDFLDKVREPVITHDLSQMRQWRALHC